MIDKLTIKRIKDFRFKEKTINEIYNNDPWKFCPITTFKSEIIYLTENEFNNLLKHFNPHLEFELDGSFDYDTIKMQQIIFKKI